MSEKEKMMYFRISETKRRDLDIQLAKSQITMKDLGEELLERYLKDTEFRMDVEAKVKASK